MSAATSAGRCSTCGKYAEKRYGGEGKYPPECLDCWTRDLTEDADLPRDLRAYADREQVEAIRG